MLYRDPCVFVVENTYQIVFNTLEFGIAWVEVGEKQYRDSVGGLMRSETLVHRVTVPMAELDAAKAYTVCFRALPERRPYFPELGEEKRKEYAFCSTSGCQAPLAKLILFILSLSSFLYC